MSEKPLYTHDCPACLYLGTYQDAARRKSCDLYVHLEGRRGACVIARYSGEGPDYESGFSVSYGVSPALTEARRRAQNRGYLQFDAFDALRYAPTTAESVQSEIDAELPFTLQYQAWLAWRNERLDRCAWLLAELMARARTQHGEYQDCEDRVALDLSKVIERMTGLQGFQALTQAYDICTAVLDYNSCKPALEKFAHRRRAAYS